MSFSKPQVLDACSAVFFLAALQLSQSSVALVPAALLAYFVVRAYLARGKPELSVLLLFGASYPLMWLLSLGLKVEIHYLAWNVEDQYVVAAFAVQGLFISCAMLAMGAGGPRNIAYYPARNDVVIFSAAILAAVLMPAIGLVASSGTSIFNQSYDFANDSSSILFEYVLIPLIIAYLYSGRSMVRRRLIFLAAAIAFVAPLFVGRRLPATMVALLILFLYFRPYRFWQQVSIVVVAFFSLSFIALFRFGATADSLASLALNIGENGAMANNQGGVVYVAGVYMKLSAEGIFDSAFGLSSFLSMLGSVFLPSSMVGEAAYVNLVAANYIPIPGNGGFPGVYFFLWGGTGVVALSGAVLGWIVRSSQKSLTAAVYVTFIFATFPRWMSYNVNILFKMGTLLILAWVVTSIAHRAATLSRSRRLVAAGPRLSLRPAVDEIDRQSRPARSSGG